MGKALAAFYGTQFFRWEGQQAIPADLKERVPSEMWKKYTCAPVERRPGVLVVAVDDPQDLTRLDGIRAMNPSPRYDFWVALKAEILAYIANSYGEALETTPETADLGKIIDKAGAAGRVE